MKQILKSLFLLFCIPLILFGADAANDLLITQRNSGNTGNVQRNITATTNTLLGWNGTSLVDITAGTGISIAAGVITSTASGTGTVTTIPDGATNGITWTVATRTTTPTFTFSLGAITPSTVNGNTVTTGTGTLTLGSVTLNAGAGGTLGSAAFTAASAYEVPLTFSTGLTRIANTITANAVNLAASGSGGVTGRLPYANLAQGSGLSILGVTGNANADNASITAGADGQILRRSGTNVGFGTIDLANSSAVAGILAVANGGTGTTTPSLVAGTNVTISGTWPNQTVTAAGGGGGTPGGANTQVQYNNSSSFGGVAGFTFDGTSKITLGVAGTSVGSVDFKNATSGTATIAPPTGVLGTYQVTLPNAASVLPIYTYSATYIGPTAARTITYPDANFTVARTDAANTFAGAQTFSTSITDSGLTSGRVTFANTAGLLADAASLTFNSGTGALSATSFTGAGTGLTGTAASLTAGAATNGVTAASAASGAGVIWQSNGADKSAVASNTLGTLSITTANVTNFTYGSTTFTGVTGTGNLVGATSPTFITPALGTPTSGTLTNATGLPEGGLSLTDITTNNVSTSKHGFAPKGDGNAAHYLDGTGAYTTPAGGGGATALSGITAATGTNTIANGNNTGQVWNWANTTNTTVAFTIGETTGATNGTSTGGIPNQVGLKLSTISASTASPLSVYSGGNHVFSVTPNAQQIVLATGSASVPTIGFAAATNTGIHRGVSGELMLTNSGTDVISISTAGLSTFSGNIVLGASTSTITGAAGNMTIVAGTGNSRTMTLQSTTSGGTATAFLTGNADQTVTLGAVPAAGDTSAKAVSAAYVATAGLVVPNAQTGTTYTLVLGDGVLGTSGVSMNNASANTLTVPTNASVAFPVGVQIPVIQLGVGATTIAAAGGVTINSPGGLLTLSGQYGAACLLKTATNTWQLVGTNSVTSAGVLGTTTNDSAAAGVLGEYVSSLVAVGSAVSLTTATAANVTSISLTAGDWDVTALANVTETTSTVTARTAGISTTSATLPTDGSEGYNGVQSTVTSETNSVPLNRKRISLTTTTTVYLVEKVTFSAGSAAGFGALNARRAR